MFEPRKKIGSLRAAYKCVYIAGWFKRQLNAVAKSFCNVSYTAVGNDTAARNAENEPNAPSLLRKSKIHIETESASL